MEYATISLAVKIQLTKTKTIEVKFPGGSSKSTWAKADLTGVELCSGESRGAPAVRIAHKKDGWHVLAAGFVPPPNGELPERWEDTPHQPVWELPRDFQSPAAAIAVNSSMGSFGQASAEAIIHEMTHGLDANRKDSSSAQKPRLGVKRQPQSSEAPAPAAPSRKVVLPSPGIPVSENGRRFTIKPFAEAGFHLAASLPEFQALWLSRLLPEGRRPTATSIQLADSALMASVLLQPEFLASDGNALAILVRRDAVYFAGYKKGAPVLWRRCPGVRGYAAMREAVCKGLGVGEDLVDSVLEDSLVDPRPALEPFLQPVMEQLDLARAYLAGKHSLKTDRAILLGLPCGAGHWRHVAEESIKMQFVAADPFDGFKIGKGVDVTDGHLLLVALGAAIAASEVKS